MQTRREFLTIAAGATAGLIALSQVDLLAANTTYDLPENIIYTETHPGRWADKAKSHVPDAKIDNSGGMVMVNVTTHHPMSEEHFIVKHTVVDQTGKVIGEKTFKPTDKPESSHMPPSGYKGKLYVISFCNLHDFWMNIITM